MPHYVLLEGAVSVQMYEVLADADAADAHPEGGGHYLHPRCVRIADDINCAASRVCAIAAPAFRLVPSD